MNNLETAWAVWGVMGGDLVVVAAYSSDRKIGIVSEALIDVYRAESEISRSIDLVEDYPPHPALLDFLSVAEPPRVET